MNKDTVSYFSSLGIEEIKTKIEDLFDEKKLNLGGKFLSEREFAAYDKLNVIGWSMPNVRRKSAYLKGKISENKGKTIVELKTKPNINLWGFSILSVITGITILLLAGNGDSNKVFLILGLIFLALGLVYYPINLFFRKRLENRVVSYLELTKI